MKHRNHWLLVGAGLVMMAAVGFWLRNTADKTPVDAAQTRSSVRTPDPGKSSSPTPRSPGDQSTSANQPAATPLASRELILTEIEDASVTYDPKALPRIEPYLLNPDPAIREAAKNGMINLGDAAAGPLLRKASEHAPTPQEAVALLDAANFVELPSGNVILKKEGLKELRRRVAESAPLRKPAHSQGKTAPPEPPASP